MKFDRWNEIRKTFQFRLAAQYVLMGSVALILSFIIALVLVRRASIGFATTEVNVSLHTARMAYLGKHEEQTEQLPEDLLTRLGKQFPRLHIGQVDREEQPSGTLYEIIASTGDEWLEILADPDGEIWAADRKTVQEVFDGVEESVHLGDNSSLSLFLCAPDGTLIAGSQSVEDFEYARRLVVQMDGLRTVRRGEGLYGGVILFDGNRLYIAKDMEEMGEITLWAAKFFLFIVIMFIPLSGWIGIVVSRKAMAGVQRVSNAAQRVKAGNFKEPVAEASDGTEIEELVHTFNDMVSHIDVLMRELREVTVNIAHDLKTPVTRIRGMLESMSWDEVTEKERDEIVDSAIEECDRTIPLIESILELSRAEAGMLVLEQEPFDLAAETRTAHSMFSTLAEDRGIVFNCALPESPVQIVGDRRRMQRVIANLIDNALKYAPDGGEVSVLLQTSGNQAVLMVSDNGPGIPANELENVFKRFYRLDPGRGMPGFGVGLSMVRAFVNAFGGTVSIASDTDMGCTVRVTVPIHPDKAGSI